MSSLSMSDLAAALGQGGGQGPPGPPDAGGIGPGDTDASGEGADTGGATPEGGDYSNSMEALDGAEEALHAYLQLEPDEADRAVAAQCLQKIVQLKAKDASDMSKLSQALQTTPGAGAGPSQMG